MLASSAAGTETVPALGGEYALPPGWEVATSRSTGEVYYVNDATGESTFERPPSADATADSSIGGGGQEEEEQQEEPLPEGWESARSESTGEVYYVNTASGESTYDDPRQGSSDYTYYENGVHYGDDAEDGPLPLGWNVATSDAGMVYYWHDETGETTYDRPI